MENFDFLWRGDFIFVRFLLCIREFDQQVWEMFIAIFSTERRREREREKDRKKLKQAENIKKKFDCIVFVCECAVLTDELNIQKLRFFDINLRVYLFVIKAFLCSIPNDICPVSVHSGFVFLFVISLNTKQEWVVWAGMLFEAIQCHHFHCYLNGLVNIVWHMVFIQKAFAAQNFVLCCVYMYVSVCVCIDFL